MVVHRARSFCFTAPSDWVDTTIARFTPTPGTVAPGHLIVVEREPLRDGESLRAHVDGAMFRIAKATTAYKTLDNRDAEIGGQPAILVRFRFSRGRARVEQGCVFVAPASDPRRNVTILTYVAIGAAARETRTVFARMLTTVRFPVEADA